MNRYKRYLLKSVFTWSALLLTGTVCGQTIIAEPRTEVKQSAGEAYQARIDFISESPDLVFEENTGAEVQKPQKKGDGNYVYTCICDVKEGNKFGFNIMLRGSEATCFWKVLVEEGQLIEVDVKVDFPAVIQVKPSGSGYHDRENAAVIRLVSASGKLEIEASTGEKAVMELNRETNTFHYNVYFDLSNPENRQIERTLFISVADQNNSLHEHRIGVLAVKQALEIAVIVINTCYDTQLSHARQSYVNGEFGDAYRMYKNLLETDLCNEDKPADRSILKEEMEKTGKYMVLMDSASTCWKKSESFYEQNRLDSCLYYLNKGTKFTSEIAKDHPLNAFCKEQNKTYKSFKKAKLGRIVSGKIYLDAGTDKPAGNTIITVSRHKKKMKKAGGVIIPVPGEEIADGYRQTYMSTVDGSFMVSVPEEANGSKTMYVIHFVAGSDREAISAEYAPGDQSTISDLHIILASGKK